MTCSECRHSLPMPGWDPTDKTILTCTKLDQRIALGRVACRPGYSPSWCPGAEKRDDARAMTLLRNPDGD